jgi:hypothetical protein
VVKVKVEVTIDVNAEAWATEFWVEKSEVRADVKEYYAAFVVAHLENSGLSKKEN